MLNVKLVVHHVASRLYKVNPLNAELNPICHMLALLGAHHILHISRIRVNMEAECCKERVLNRKSFFPLFAKL